MRSRGTGEQMHAAYGCRTLPRVGRGFSSATMTKHAAGAWAATLERTHPVASSAPVVSDRQSQLLCQGRRGALVRCPVRSARVCLVRARRSASALAGLNLCPVARPFSARRPAQKDEQQRRRQSQ
jgi:hypothetical protein